MQYPCLHKECAVVCSARPRALSITFHFVLQSSGPVPHTATTDLMLTIVGPQGKAMAVRPTVVQTSRRMLLVSVQYEEGLVRRLKAGGTRVRVERLVRNGAETPAAWECEVVSVFESHGEGL